MIFLICLFDSHIWRIIAKKCVYIWKTGWGCAAFKSKLESVCFLWYEMYLLVCHLVLNLSAFLSLLFFLFLLCFFFVCVVCKSLCAAFRCEMRRINKIGLKSTRLSRRKKINPVSVVEVVVRPLPVAHNPNEADLNQTLHDLNLRMFFSPLSGCSRWIFILSARW